MCGFAGILNTSATESINESSLLAMRDTMLARGPDDAGLWMNANKTVGLAHRRLSIIDLSSAAKQPFSDLSERYHLIFNGEIYNYRELAAELKAHHVELTTTSDTEVLLQAYIHFGLAFLNKLRGMFAFAIWDEEKQLLFMARDPFGIKPLYYAEKNGVFYFASQVKALLKHPAMSRELSNAGQVGFYLWGHVPEPHTLYKEIKAFPAGFTLTVVRQQKQWQQYFDFTESYLEARHTEVNPLQLQEEVRYVLQDSIAHHLIADTPVGVFLSAGKDSSTILGLASEYQAQVKAITLGFSDYKNTEKDEVPLAQKIAQYYGADWQQEDLSHEDFLSEQFHFWQAMDQPSIDGANTFFVSRAAKQAGLKVALSGIGADELFAGYRDFDLIKQLMMMSRWLPGLSQLGALVRPLLQSWIKPKQASLFEYMRSVPQTYFLLRCLNLPWQLTQFLPKTVVQSGLAELQTTQRLHRATLDLPDYYAQIHALHMQWYMQNQLLRDADWAGMAHSLEIRVPFVDIDVFKVLAKISAYVWPDKSLMCQSLKKPLPPAILQRRKTGFNIPVQQWESASHFSSRKLTPAQSWAATVLKNYLEHL